LGGGYFDLHHMKVADTTYYHAQSYHPNGSYTACVIKKMPDSTTFIYMDTIPGAARLGRHMEILPNGNFLIIGSRVPHGGGSGQMTAIEMDENGKVISEVASPWSDNSFETRAVVKVNDDEYIILALAYFTKDEESHFYFNVYRYNHKTKKLIWRHKENKYATPIFGADGFIIKGHKENEYLYCSAALNENVTPSFYYTRGQIVKINGEGKTIWNKYYFFTSDASEKNLFNHIIATSDGHYLAAGTSTPSGFSAWAIKIDEDGNIVPIDTSTSSVDVAIPEIKIYPNPASDYIIINQGEQSDMAYTLYDMQGRQVAHIDIKTSHTNVVWDLPVLQSGSYQMIVTQKGKKVMDKKIVVVR
jgi:uncharacterized protein YuzE